MRAHGIKCKARDAVRMAGLNVSSGALPSGGGSNHVLAYCDGTNWTVAAK